MTKKNQIGNLTNEIFTGNSGAIWINEIYGDPKNLKGNAVGGNDIINGGNDGATNHLYGDAYSMEGNAKGGVDTITGGSNGATNYIYGDAYSMERNTKGGVDTITGGANGATNYIYGDAYRMKGNVQGGNDILVGGLNAKNFIYGDAFAVSNGAKAGDDAISLANVSSLSLAAVNVYSLNSANPDLTPTASSSILNNTLIGDSDNIENSSSGTDSINVGNNSTVHIQDVSINSYNGSDIKALSNVSLDISKNSLIGDANSLKNSSSGNDLVGVGNNIESKLGKTTVGSYSSNSKSSASSTVSINLSSNRLVGDAENIASSSAGDDSLSIGNNLKTTVGDVSTISIDGGASESNILFNLKFLDNVLLGDADRLKNSSAGNDAISLGNNIQNTIGKFYILTGDGNSFINPSSPIISSNVSADFALSGNDLIGDAATIERSTAGKDTLGIGNNFKNSLDSINSESFNKLSLNASETISYEVSNNRLFGDAKNMTHSSSGADTIGVGNNLKNSIGEIKLLSSRPGEARFSAAASYSITENSLIGDSLSIKNSSAGDDILEVGNNFSNVFQKISSNVNSGKTSVISLDSNFTVSNNSLIGDAENMRNSSSGDDVISVGNAFNADIAAIDSYALSLNSFADTTVSLKYTLLDNRLIGDAKTMQDSSGGDDRLAVGNDLTISFSSINNIVYSSGSIQSNVLFNFSLSDNFLLGDAEIMKNSNGGHDIIQLGNSFKNNLGDSKGESYYGSSIKSSVKTKLSLSDNTLYGDAKVMSHSQGGNDIISIGNDFVSSVGTITSTVFNNSTDTSVVSVIYTLENNTLYGDAETMSYSKGGNDTLSIGLGIVGDSYLTLDIKDNTLYGDANTMKRSQGGDDKLTGADGEGSVTYLYGDAKFTDGKSGAGNDTLISGHGNDHMWGDFGSYLYRADLHDEERRSELGDDDDDHHDSEYEDDSPAIYVNYSSGKDIFVFGGNNGNDIIYDFQRGLDKIDLRSLGGIDGIDDFTITSSLTQSSDRVIDFGNGNSITLIGVSELSANDFMFAAVV